MDFSNFDFRHRLYALRPQGGTMYWKTMLSIALDVSVGLIPCFAWSDRNGPDSRGPIRNAVELAALTSGIIGFDQFRRGEQKKALRTWRNCLFAWFSASLISLGVTRLYKMTIPDWALHYWVYLAWVLFAASLPVALYLNRNQSKSALQPTTDNAS
jgi:hypothetical protein